MSFSLGICPIIILLVATAMIKVYTDHDPCRDLQQGIVWLKRYFYWIIIIILWRYRLCFIEQQIIVIPHLITQYPGIRIITSNPHRHMQVQLRLNKYCHQIQIKWLSWFSFCSNYWACCFSCVQNLTLHMLLEKCTTSYPLKSHDMHALFILVWPSLNLLRYPLILH